MLPLDPFNLGAEQYSAAAAWLSVAVLSVTFIVIWRQLAVAAALRRDQSRPYVVPSIASRQGALVMIRVENIGATPARNIRLEFLGPEPDSIKASITWIGRGMWGPDGMSVLPPKHHLEFSLDSLPWRTEAWRKDPNSVAMAWDVRVTYNDADGKSLPHDDYCLDLMPFVSALIPYRPDEEAAKHLKRLADSAGKWTQHDGLHVQVHDRNRRTDDDLRSVDLERMVEAIKARQLLRAVQIVMKGWLERRGWRRYT